MTASATLSTKFQISIPKAIRETQHWSVGQEFVFLPKGSGVMLVPVPSRESLFGIAKGSNMTGYRDRDDRV